MCTQAILENLSLKLGMSNLKGSLTYVTFHQFCVFTFDPMPENKNAESAESIIKFLPTPSVIIAD